MSLVAELKRRNVVRMAVLYAVGSWLVLQIADVLFEQLGVPGWAFRLVLGLLILGFPITLVFSWLFELTPEGIKREREIERNDSITRKTGQKINITIIVLLLLAIGGLIADRLIPEQSGVVSQQETTVDKKNDMAELPLEGESQDDDLSIAVLPFINMSGDPENEYFSDGLSEELLNSLVQIRELKVTGRTSSFAFKGQNLDLREVGERLNVAHVLEGSVRKAANRVRITAQLVKTEDGYHLWSETFDRELVDIFAIQQEISEQVAKAMSITLLGANEPVAGHTENAEAFQLYLRGIHVLRRSPDDLESLTVAKDYFEQAIALDPEYISPWDGMLLYWSRMNRNGNVDYDLSIAKMREHATKLSQLAPQSEEALLGQSLINMVERNWARSEIIVKEARDRYPGSARTSTAFGQLNFNIGNPEEALKASEDAVRLDPLDLESLVRLMAMNARLKNCDTTFELMNRAIELEPGLGRVNGSMGMCLLLTEEDATGAKGWFENEPVGFIRRTGLAIANHRLGLHVEAEQQLKQMMEDYGDSAAYQYAQVHAQWSEVGKSLQWLQKAIDTNDPGAILMKMDPFLDPIRELPQFQEMMIQMGLAQIQGEQQ